MARFTDRLLGLYLGAILVIGIAWVIGLPQYFGVSLIAAEWIGPMLGIGIAASMLKHPYRETAGLLDVALGLAGIAAWVWMSVNYDAWIIDIAGYSRDKFVPAIAALVLLMEAMRKAAGLPITILVWLLIAYAFFGYLLPPPFEAERLSVQSFAMYVYADTNGVPGRVMTVVGTLVLAFIVFGRLLEHSGALRFFTDLAMAGMGHRRGGPAKVAVVASSVFGSINGTVIGNMMSTGVVTIPLMKRSGFKPHFAGAIEAVASNGGQIAPPVMGATAFLIAEFLELGYAEVVAAALVPAVLYYVCLFVQVDAIAARYALHGLPKSELPAAGPLIRDGWVFLAPLALLVYLLFGRNLDPALAAMAAVVALLALSVLRQRRLPGLAELKAIALDGGTSMLPLLMIGGGAGVVIGVMNITGLGFSLSLVLSRIGENAGLIVMLLLTAAIAIVLGMGMPTTAIYVVLSVVLAPALVEMGIEPLGAHLFIFYFGLLSFLTPPVAIASYVGAGLAGSSMWRTSWEGVKLAAVAYLLPLLWCYNPALLLQGSAVEIVAAIATALVGALLIGLGMQHVRFRHAAELAAGIGLFAAAILVGGSTVWFGAASPLNWVAAGGGLVLLVGASRWWAGYAARIEARA